MKLRLLSLLAGLGLCLPVLLAQDPPAATDPDTSEVGISSKAAIKGSDSNPAGDYYRAWYAPGGSTIRWSVSPRPANVRMHAFPGAHAVCVWVPPGEYTLTAEITTTKYRLKKLDKPLDKYKEGDELPVDAQVSIDYLTKRFTATGFGPQPPPPPGPLPPEPKPADTPFPGVTGLHLLVVYDADRPQPATVWQTRAVADYMRSKGADNWRVWNNVIDVSGAAPKWRTAYGKAPSDRASLPWVAVGSATGGYAGPAPTTAAEAIALLKKHGGD